MNKFENGEQDKNKLKSISGVEYYKQHIHVSQAMRLKRFVKDASGKTPNSKRFVPLTDVEKPSMQGRVKMYMQKLTDEEQRAKNPVRRGPNYKMSSMKNVQDHLSIQENGGYNQKSQSMLV